MHEGIKNVKNLSRSESVLTRSKSYINTKSVYFTCINELSSCNVLGSLYTKVNLQFYERLITYSSPHRVTDFVLSA